MTTMTEHEIYTEEYREYRYADGRVYNIKKPIRLWVKKGDSGDSHRVLDSDGLTHCPAKGWVAIVWYAPNAPVSF